MKMVGIRMLLLALLVLLTRLPFLSQGYGSEDDSWGLVLNARQMAETGEYSFSRLPGHPVQEYVLMLMPYAGAFVMNLLSALFSVAAVICFAFILRVYKIHQWLLWSVVFATIPIIWISSTYTIDYIWALAFVLFAWLALLKRRYTLVALFLGFAIACRITSGAVLIGFAWIAFRQEGRKLPQVVWMGVLTMVVAACWYFPSWLRYGWSFFDTYRLPYPSLPKVIYKATFGVWGLSGFIAILLLLWQKLRNQADSLLPDGHLTAIILNILLYLAAFLVLPQKSAFWTPALPFMLFWLVYQIRKPTLVNITAILFLLSSITGGFNLANAERGANYSKAALVRTVAGQEVFFDPLNGPLQNEYSRRENRQVYIESAVKAAQKLDSGALVLCGWWTNQFIVNCQDQGACQVQVAEFFNKTQLDSVIKSGTRIWYLSEIDQANDERYQMNYTASVGRKLD